MKRLLSVLPWLTLAFTLATADAGPWIPQTQTGDDPAATAGNGPPEDLQEELQQLRADLASATTLDESTRGQIEAALTTSEESISQASAYQEQLESLEELPAPSAQRETLEQQLAQFRESKDESVDIPENESALAQEINATREKIDGLTRQLAETEQTANRRTSRREEIRTRLLQIESKLPEINAQLTALPEDDPSLLVRAQRLQWASSKARLEREEAWLRAELGRIDAEEKADILRLQRDLYSGQLEHQQNILALLERARGERQMQAAEKTASEAKQQQTASENQNPVLAESLQINTQLAEQNESFVKQKAAVAATANDLRERLNKLEGQFRQTRSMIEQIGLPGSVGDLLRQQKSELPNIRVNINQARETQQEVESIQFQLFDLRRRLNALDEEIVITEILDSHRDASRQSLQELESEIQEIVQLRREILDAARGNARELFDSLVETEYRYRRLAEVARQYREYLNERIFWIRSNKFLFTEWSLDDSDLRLLQTEHWQTAANRFFQLLKRNVFPFALLVIVLCVFIGSRGRLRKAIRRMGDIAGRGSCASFWPTVKTLLASLLLAIMVPLPLIVVGLMVQNSSLNDGKSLFSAIGAGLLAAGVFAIPIEFLKHVCREGGLAQKHLAWPDHAVRILKFNFGWANPLWIALVLMIGVLYRLDLTHRIDVVERILFVAGMAGLFLFLKRCLSPAHGVFHQYLKQHPQSWANQTSSLWYVVTLSFPIVLALLAIMGYYYTTLSLVIFGFYTVIFGIVVETLRALFKRFILVRRRHIHIETARRRREAEREQRKLTLQAQVAAGESGAAAVVPEPTPESDPLEVIQENVIQARKLINLVMWIVWALGLWVIWADVLPALNALDKKPIFAGTVLAPVTPDSGASPPPASGGEAPAPGGTQDETTTIDPPADATGLGGLFPGTNGAAASATQTPGELGAVTYGDLLLFLVIAAITIAAARSLPSTLEMIFLSELPVDRSIRYATKSLISYFIILVGLVFGFRALSISWSNVQWLATALTFGLAFGLQEIFANFVAGIILMFERPMRIGDLITIDQYTGVVTKIRTRATTIVNWDRKEYVIPNKDFITGRLVNWTLSDSINRIEITVGVAYGSDVVTAKQILLDVAKAHSTIVDDPPSFVTFQEFGDSSLVLVLRAFLRDLEHRLATIDQLHTEINQRFRDAGIEISFPQRDLHLRSVDPKIGIPWIQGPKKAIATDSPDGPNGE